MQKFKNTSEIEVLDEILGQERAIRAMEVGLKIDNPAYNIYVSGHSGTAGGINGTKSAFADDISERSRKEKIRRTESSAEHDTGSDLQTV